MSLFREVSLASGEAANNFLAKKVSRRTMGKAAFYLPTGLVVAGLASGCGGVEEFKTTNSQFTRIARLDPYNPASGELIYRLHPAKLPPTMDPNSPYYSDLLRVPQDSTKPIEAELENCFAYHEGFLGSIGNIKDPNTEKYASWQFAVNGIEPQAEPELKILWKNWRLTVLWEGNDITATVEQPKLRPAEPRRTSGNDSSF